ncbi:TNF receptor-associated factor 6-like [Tubulanus polymorphus]|uniref:TNF receptor-associated factor 6-like n=1 Tax=Tubulanus polymorphus TaxID=672921 RepID=UPI003DA4EEB0
MTENLDLSLNDSINPPGLSCSSTCAGHVTSSHAPPPSESSLPVIEGYAYEFVPKLDEKYECTICQLGLREPVQTVCGHRFCKACIQKWIREARSICPVDNQELDEGTLFPDNFAKREIMSLIAKCPYSTSGCMVEAEVRTIENHELTCDYRPVPCLNEGCKEMVVFCRMMDHLQDLCIKRKVPCVHCRKDMAFDAIEAHVNQCPVAPVTCKFCAAQMQRSQMSRHIDEECQSAVVPCLFSVYGCLNLVKRKRMIDHVNESLAEHLLLLNDGLKLLQSTCEDHARLEDISAKQSELRLHMLEQAQKRSKEFTANFASDSDDCCNASPAGVSHRSNGINDSQYDSACCSAQTNYSLNPELSMTSLASSPVALLDRIKELEATMASQKQLIYQLDIQNKHLETRLKKQETTAQKQLESFQEFQSQLANGIYLWQIENFNSICDRAASGQSRVLHSPGFYTSAHGYKVCLRVNLSVSEERGGTMYLSVFIHLMNGIFDDILHWPFHAKVALTLLDQHVDVNQRSHVIEQFETKPQLAAFQRPSGDRNFRGFGYTEFISLSALQAGRYIKPSNNGTVVIKAQIDEMPTR